MSNPNPTRKFKKGEVANPTGRPKKGTSLTELMKEYLERIPEGSEVSYKEAFVAKVFRIAYEKEDPVFAKMIWNYVDGMPKQTADITSNGKTITPILGGMTLTEPDVREDDGDLEGSQA